jgi:hypothetical protein
MAGEDWSHGGHTLSLLVESATIALEVEEPASVAVELMDEGCRDSVSERLTGELETFGAALSPM